MSKPKFKVNDEVRLKKSVKAGDCMDGYVLYDSMYDDLQKPHKITKIEKYQGHSGFVALISGWYVPDEWLEHIKPEKIIIYRNGAEVVAKNTATGKTGVAKCNPVDEFDFNTGAKLAFERLTNPEPEKPKYYSGKVVCVASLDEDFTVGKIYTFENGKTKDNDGWLRPMGYRVKDINHYSTNSAYTFVQLIED